MARSQRSLSLGRGRGGERGSEGRRDGERRRIRTYLRHSAHERRVAPRLRFFSPEEGSFGERSGPGRMWSWEDMVVVEMAEGDAGGRDKRERRRG